MGATGRAMMLGALLALGAMGGAGLAAVPVEKHASVTLDWRAQEIRFVGEASAPSYREAELKARQSGKEQARRDLEALLQERLSRAGVSDAADRVAQIGEELIAVCRSSRTEYLADGRVKVHFAAKVPAAFAVERAP